MCVSYSGVTSMSRLSTCILYPNLQRLTHAPAVIAPFSLSTCSVLYLNAKKYKSQLVNPGFAGGATAESMIRASFSPDGRFVVSGSEKGRVRVWEAQEGKRVRTPLQVNTTSCLEIAFAWIHANTSMWR